MEEKVSVVTRANDRVFFKDLVHIMVDADLELIVLESPGEGKKLLEKNHGPWHRWENQVVSMGRG